MDNVLEYFKNLNCNICCTDEECNGEYAFCVYNKFDHDEGKKKNPEKWIVAVGKHKGIISSENWLRVQNILLANAHKGGNRKIHNEVTLLSGILRCKCGAYMRPKKSRSTKKRKYNFHYMCELKERSKRSRCNQPNINGNILDEVIINELFNYGTNNSVINKQLKIIEDNINKTDIFFDKEKNIKGKILECQTLISNLVRKMADTSDVVSKIIQEEIEKYDDELNNLQKELDFQIKEQQESSKKKIKKLRKASSVFVREQFATELQKKIEEYGLGELCTLEAEPDGEGDGTYPEPRKIFIRYQSALTGVVDYLQPVVMLEIGSRSLFEPNEKCHIHSILEEQFPSIYTSLVDAEVATSIPGKTFLEKVFLIHEMFSVEGHGVRAERKSRHLYDLYRMMNMDFALKATTDEQLWESIRHHREIFTSVSGMDYTPDVRKRMQLVPRPDIIDAWKLDYETMMETMIYGDKPSFSELIAAMTDLQERFRNASSNVLLLQ